MFQDRAQERFIQTPLRKICGSTDRRKKDLFEWNIWEALGISHLLMKSTEVKFYHNLVKIMYYRDLIWKIWFGSDWKVKIDSYGSGSIDYPRYFVGRGNNSKLIKRIMNKRWWWKQ